jgi:hypothetical protein
MTTSYFSGRASAARIALAVLATAGIMVAAYLVAALLLAVIVGTVPTVALTSWFQWTVALVQAVPLYIGAWLAGMSGTRIAGWAAARPTVVRVAAMMAAPCVITIVLAAMSTRAAWFATALAVIVAAAGSLIGAVRRRSGTGRE